MTKFVEVWTYDQRYEVIRADQIETVTRPGVGVHDHGAVVLLGGRRIAFGQVGEAERLIQALKA